MHQNLLRQNAVPFRHKFDIRRNLTLIYRPSRLLSITVDIPFISFPMETFSALLAIVRGIHRSPVNSPHKGQSRGALMFPLICPSINAWVNNLWSGDLRRHRGQYNAIVMFCHQTRSVVLYLQWTGKSKYCKEIACHQFPNPSNHSKDNVSESFHCSPCVL